MTENLKWHKKYVSFKNVYFYLLIIIIIIIIASNNNKQHTVTEEFTVETWVQFDLHVCNRNLINIVLNKIYKINRKKVLCKYIKECTGLLEVLL